MATCLNATPPGRSTGFGWRAGPHRLHAQQSELEGLQAPWRLSDGKTIASGNLPWRSLTDMDREDAGYHAFVRPLAEAIARTVQASLHRQARPREPCPVPTGRRLRPFVVLAKSSHLHREVAGIFRDCPVSIAPRLCCQPSSLPNCPRGFGGQLKVAGEYRCPSDGRSGSVRVVKCANCIAGSKWPFPMARARSLRSRMADQSSFWRLIVFSPKSRTYPDDQ